MHTMSDVMDMVSAHWALHIEFVISTNVFDVMDMVSAHWPLHKNR